LKPPRVCTAGGFAVAGGGGAFRGAGDSQQQTVLPMVWGQAPGGGMVPVPMQIPDDREWLGNGGQLALLVGRPAAEGGHSCDGETPATPAAPTPATMFAGLSMVRVSGLFAAASHSQAAPAWSLLCLGSCTGRCQPHICCFVMQEGVYAPSLRTASGG